MGLQLLSMLLHKHYSKEYIIIIDEYDTPIQQGHSCNFYLEIVNVMRNFFSGALKNNSHLAFGFLTGILRVAEESILTIDWKQRDYWGNYRIGHTGNHRRIL